MRRQITALALLVSFAALASSGLLMLVIGRPAFTLQMHPVHKLFGIILILAALSHLQLNARSLWAHLARPGARIAAVVLGVALVLTYAVAWLNPVPAELAQALDTAGKAAEVAVEAR